MENLASGPGSHPSQTFSSTLRPTTIVSSKENQSEHPTGQTSMGKPPDRLIYS
jgi:hypothetical protein